ncbi:MAG: ATP-grasp domain-containing protein [Promethearchaeota archaeon]|nr:MAG: ATP-grasp domain-containing protein [Candidatus Lokiarchaeota archaeon]
MKIGILSKRTGFLTGKLKEFYESNGHIVKIYTKENLCIDESLLENDFYILKSKHPIPFINAGYFIQAHNIPVIPDVEISYKHKNRIEANLLIKNAGLLGPLWYYGTLETIKKNLKKNDFPLILKPIEGSGSKGIRIINKINEFKKEHENLLYLEKLIEGVHYTVYFIGDEVCVMEKLPLKNEHSEMTRRDTTDTLREIIFTWKNKYALLFGHLDIVIENETCKHFVVDPGSFPEFTNWKCGGDPVSLIGNLILMEYEKQKKEKS